MEAPPRFVDGSRLLADAFRVARDAHAEPRGQDTGIDHPVHVAAILADHGYSEDVLAAALLHDVVEDTSLRLEDIARMFGARVAELVAMLTEDATIEPYRTRKANHRERLTAADGKAAAIFAADKLAKLHELASESKSVEPAKLDHYAESLAMLRSAHPSIPFLDELDRQLSAYCETVRDEHRASA